MFSKKIFFFLSVVKHFENVRKNNVYIPKTSLGLLNFKMLFVVIIYLTNQTIYTYINSFCLLNHLEMPNWLNLNPQKYTFVCLSSQFIPHIEQAEKVGTQSKKKNDLWKLCHNYLKHFINYMSISTEVCMWDFFYVTFYILFYIILILY